jgi:hypothetical protein
MQQLEGNPKMKMKMYLSGAGLVLLTACNGINGTTASTTVTNDIAATELSLTAAENLALVYTQLPRCSAGATTAVCSDPTVVASIKAADTTAYNAVKAAENNPALAATAASAVNALSAVIPAAK